MSVTIRLSRTGKRNAPSYRIVVANTRDKRNGRFIDIIGHYNPSENPIAFEYDKNKFESWRTKGALVTEAVQKLIEGTYEFKPYNPSLKKGAERDKPEKVTADVDNAPAEQEDPVEPNSEE